MVKKTTNIFFRKKPIQILLVLMRGEGEKYGSFLAKKTDSTYSHVVKILKELKNMGLIEFEKKGRTKQIKLTQKGREVGEHIKKIKELLS